MIHEDPLDPARGVIVGTVLGFLAWVALIVLVRSVLP